MFLEFNSNLLISFPLMFLLNSIIISLSLTKISLIGNSEFAVFDFLAFLLSSKADSSSILLLYISSFFLSGVVSLLSFSPKSITF